jgi:hypothetical protein
MVPFLSATAFAGPDVEKQVNFLQRAKEPKDRADSAEALGNLGPAAKSAAGALCRAMLDQSELVRRTASKALERVRPDLHPHVVTLLADSNNVNHLLAVQSIRKMKEEGRPAAWILLRHLELEMGHARLLTRAEFNTRVKGLARDLRAIKQFFDPKVSDSQYLFARALDEILDEVDEDTLKQIGKSQYVAFLVILANLRALAELDGENTAVLKALCQVYSSDVASKCPAIRFDALLALGEIAKDHPKSRQRLLPIFVALLKASDVDSRRMCLYLLPNFGKDAKKTLRLLKNMSRTDSSELIREEVAGAIEAIEGE